MQQQEEAPFSRQIFLQRGNILVEKTSPAQTQDHHVVVRVHYSFISSGTEIATVKSSESQLTSYITNISRYTAKLYGAFKEHGVAGTHALIKERQHKILSLGYACAGEIIACGKNVKNLRIGDYVACAGTNYAYHADIISVPQNLTVRVARQDDLKDASITTLGAIALQGIRRADVSLGHTVCVIGLGLIGQLTVQLAKRAGATVIGIDIKNDRIALAYQSGADTCLHAGNVDIVREISYLTDHHGVDITLITASSQASNIVQDAMNITRCRGRVVVVGDVKLTFDREPFYRKEIDFSISCSYGPGRYDVAYEQESIDYPYAHVRWTERRNMAYIVSLIEKKLLSLKHLVTECYNINDAKRAYAKLKDGALGVILSYEHETINKISATPSPLLSSHATAYTYPTEKTQVALIGAGGFAKTKILPIIAQLDNTSIHSIVDIDAATALTIARVYRTQRACNNYHRILHDGNINVAVITSPHAHHAEQALACLKNGKAVLVEKPAAISFEQLEKLKSFFAINPTSPYCVDFNRSCSPFMEEVKKHLSLRTQPAFITYRMNAGYMSPDHWTQSEEHGGRIIGEACHIFDLFCFLLESTPLSLHVGTSISATNTLTSPDNVVATITMRDGSCCSLAYSSYGHHDAGKEYMEIFYDGKTIIMNDFLELKGFGLPLSFNKRVSLQDKGHQKLYTQFFEAVRNCHASMPIPLERILRATEITLIVDALAKRGGGSESL